MAKVAKTSNKKLVLLDAHAIIHRAYHALPEFASSNGEPTGALYGLSTMLMKIIVDLKPDYIVACYDLPDKTFRHEAYKDYKAGRAKTEDTLVAQLISSRRVFEAFEIPCIDSKGFEADDILGTIVEILKKEKIDIVIASGDMDTMQLIDGKKVQVYTLKKGIQDTIIYDETAVVARFNFKPELLPDYKGLRGDPSDNIIGIKGIGEKTAEILISKFGTIENIYKVLKKKPEQIKEAGITDRIIKLLQEGEEEALFSKTLATIRRDAPIEFKIPEQTFLEKVDGKKVESLFRNLEFRSLVMRAEIFKNKSDQAKGEEVKEVLNKNDEEDLEKLKIAIWLLNSDLNNVTNDDVLYFQNSKNFTEAKFKILEKIKKENLSYVYENIELPIMQYVKAMQVYGIKINIDYLKTLSFDYHIELSKLEKKIYEYAGLEFNINSPKQLGEILFDKMGLEPEKGKKMKKTAGGARSTKESELEKLKDSHPIIGEILKHRELQKLLSTYIDVLPNLADDTGRIHAKFIQAGTTTGRFSSTDPNLQNIPVKSELGKNIRFAFVAPKGKKLLSFDYSQIELRVAALLSQDEFLIKVFKEGKDVHNAVAMKVFNVEDGAVTAEMRRRAKVINFGILYGMGVTALQTNLGTTRKEAQEFYDNYFAQFPKISGYLDSVILEAKERGYTETLFGRRRYFPGLKSPLPFIRAMAERMAINAPIQGTAADIMKIAIKVSMEAISNNNLQEKAHLIMQIHDEIVFEVDEDGVEEIVKIVEGAMLNIIPKEFVKLIGEDVPLAVHSSIGVTFGDLK